jgi:hypothetical protein
MVVERCFNKQTVKNYFTPHSSTSMYFLVVKKNIPVFLDGQKYNITQLKK